MLIGGLAMLIVGIILTVNISATMPAGQVWMSEDEILDLMIAQQETQDYNTLSGILIGIGFLLVLISFGARKRKGSAKKVEKKPVEWFKPFNLKLSHWYHWFKLKLVSIPWQQELPVLVFTLQKQ